MIEYRDIAGFSNYMISNDGKVYSKYISRNIGYYLNHGYPHVRVKNDVGEWKYVKIHRLVAKKFNVSQATISMIKNNKTWNYE